MPDFLDTLAMNAKASIEKGFYKFESKHSPSSRRLTDLILECTKVPIISELKLASPTSGITRKNADVGWIVQKMERGGAVGISVLTEPKYFKGSLRLLADAGTHTRIPILMKDFILCYQQIDAACNAGAKSVLFIQALFDRAYCENELQEMINYAHSKQLEVLLETHTEKEFESALSTDADMIGINNRDLSTLEVDLNTTRRILQKIDPKDRMVVSESGIKTSEDIRFLRKCGARAFLVGSSIMRANNIEKAVEELVNAT